MKNRTKKTELLRSRCEPTLKREVVQVAMFQGLDESDIVRIACMQFVQKFKQPTHPASGIFANA
jgi:antitoxin component of RelBE/YafQ-DinJ toxin-antitoxin module